MKYSLLHSAATFYTCPSFATCTRQNRIRCIFLRVPLGKVVSHGWTSFENENVYLSLGKCTLPHSSPINYIFKYKAPQEGKQ